MALLNFDATRVEPTVAMELLPAGKYTVEIYHAGLVVGKSGIDLK